ncbi:MAG: potassium channel family protein [Nitrosarchaeum sp.]|nr:potassium channel family protein [Nitrosarchaeum sp.]
MLIHLLAISAGILLIGTVVIFLIESPNDDSEIKTMLDAVWWTAATVTTVGYGDIVPITDVGRIIGIIFMFVGISILGIFISTIGATLIRTRLIHGKQDLTNDEQYKKIMKRIQLLEETNQKDKELMLSILKEIQDSIKYDPKI